MSPITFQVTGEVKAQPRARSSVVRGKGGRVILKNGQPIIRAYESGSAENWKSLIAIAAREHRPGLPLLGPLMVDIEFRFKRPKLHYRTNGQLKPNAPVWHTSKPDRDNCEKAVTDTLKVLGMFGDDCQVCAGQILKRYSYLEDGEFMAPGATITITPLAEPSAKPTAEQPTQLAL